VAQEEEMEVQEEAVNEQTYNLYGLKILGPNHYAA